MLKKLGSLVGGDLYFTKNTEKFKEVILVKKDIGIQAIYSFTINENEGVFIFNFFNVDLSFRNLEEINKKVVETINKYYKKEAEGVK